MSCKKVFRQSLDSHQAVDMQPSYSYHAVIQTVVWKSLGRPNNYNYLNSTILFIFQQEEAIAVTTATMNSAPNTPVVPPTSTRSFASKLKLKKAASLTPSKKVSMVLPKAPQLPAAEFWLSIGRIFHRVTLSTNKSTIKITRYRPRQLYKAERLDYRYRFGAPDNDNYEVSW